MDKSSSASVVDLGNNANIIPYFVQRFFQDIESDEIAMDIIDHSISLFDSIMDNKRLVQLEATIMSELAFLQIQKLASLSCLPYDEDLINDDSSFWDIEEEAAPIPNDLWASGLARTIKIPKPESMVPNSKSTAPSVSSHKSFRSNVTGVTRQTRFGAASVSGDKKKIQQLATATIPSLSSRSITNTGTNSNANNNNPIITNGNYKISNGTGGFLAKKLEDDTQSDRTFNDTDLVS